MPAICAEGVAGYLQRLGIPEPGRPSFGLRAQHAVFDRLVYGKLRAALGGRAQYAVSGGAALSERLCHFFRGIGVTVLEGYGLTETTAAATVNRPDRNKIGTVGQPLPGVGIMRPAAWMSLGGRPQQTPDRDTRGFFTADGQRRWLDVFPDVNAP